MPYIIVNYAVVGLFSTWNMCIFESRLKRKRLFYWGVE